MSVPPPLLSCQGLEAGYGASQVLFGIDLAISEGEVATLLGRNGMGRTTTLRALFGGPAARSDVEKAAGSRADTPAVSIRSTVGDPATEWRLPGVFLIDVQRVKISRQTSERRDIRHVYCSSVGDNDLSKSEVLECPPLLLRLT